MCSETQTQLLGFPQVATQHFGAVLFHISSFTFLRPSELTAAACELWSRQEHAGKCFTISFPEMKTCVHHIGVELTPGPLQNVKEFTQK